MTKNTPEQMPIKVLFVIGSLEAGGTETQLVALASGLDRRFFDPIVCCLQTAGELAPQMRAAGVPVHVLNFDGRFRARRRLIRDLYRLLRREQPAIVHGMLLWAYVLGAFVGRAARVPCVVASRRNVDRPNRPIILLLERLATRMTDVVIANSEAVRQHTIARERIAPSRLLVIPNGLDVARFDAPEAASLGNLLDVSDAPRVIVVANLIHYKGHEYFLHAWERVLVRFPSAVAMLVGDGVRRAELEQMVDQLGISPNVRFLGVRHDVPALLALSDVSVHPSLQEGSSNAVLEAMAAGKPVVATAVGGTVEAIDDTVTGFLVPARDAAALADRICRLLGDRNLANRMGARAREYIRERHAVDKMVSAYEAVYTELVSVRSARRRAVPRPTGRFESAGKGN